MKALTDNELIAAFSRLPARRRRIFWLVNSEGYKFAEVARELGIGVKIVRRELLRAYDCISEIGQ